MWMYGSEEAGRRVAKLLLHITSQEIGRVLGKDRRVCTAPRNGEGPRDLSEEKAIYVGMARGTEGRPRESLLEGTHLCLATSELLECGLTGFF